MKENKNSISLNHNLLTEKTSFEEFQENLKKSIFGVLFVLLKAQDFSILVDIIFLILEILQFMSFPFNAEVTSIIYLYSSKISGKRTSLILYPTFSNTSRSLCFLRTMKKCTKSHFTFVYALLYLLFSILHMLVTLSQGIDSVRFGL
jgi:hypothetical protein